jgi:hypothetical protein
MQGNPVPMMTTLLPMYGDPAFANGHGPLAASTLSTIARYCDTISEFSSFVYSEPNSLQ